MNNITTRANGSQGTPSWTHFRRPAPHRLAASLGLTATLSLLTPLAVLAQATAADPEAPARKLERVEVTGSAIKRIADQGALPVQVLTRQDITKAGVTTAAELLATVSAASKA